MSPDYIIIYMYTTLVEVPLPAQYTLRYLSFFPSLLFLCAVVTGASEGIGKGYATEVKRVWNEGMTT